MMLDMTCVTPRRDGLSVTSQLTSRSLGYVKSLPQCLQTLFHLLTFKASFTPLLFDFF